MIMNTVGINNDEAFNLAFALIESELNLSLEQKIVFKEFLDQNCFVGTQTFVNKMKKQFPATNFWPRGLDFLEAKNNDIQPTLNDVAELFFNVFNTAIHKIYRAYQINDMLKMESHSPFKYAKVCINHFEKDNASACGLFANGGVYPIADMVPFITTYICEHLDCSCRFILRTERDLTRKIGLNNESCIK